MFCPSCGKEIQTAVNFCPHCGYSLTGVIAETASVAAETETEAAETTSSTTPVFTSANRVSVNTSSSSGKYTLVLVAKGTCSASILSDLLEDVFGYSSSEASKLINVIPCEIAVGLTSQQAEIIAQMFTEYGAEMTVHDESDNYVDLSSSATSSVFNTDGTLMAAAAVIIAGVAAVNRVTSFRRYERKPSLLNRIFHTLFKPAPPKRYHRVRPRPAVKPAVRKPAIVKPSAAKPAKISKPGGLGRKAGGGGHGPGGGKGGRH